MIHTVAMIIITILFLINLALIYALCKVSSIEDRLREEMEQKDV